MRYSMLTVLHGTLLPLVVLIYLLVVLVCPLVVLVCWLTARKTIFSSSKFSEKIIFPKKSNWKMIFLVSSRKIIFLFPENMTLFFRQKMEDDLSQKKYVEIWYILDMFWKDGLYRKDNISGIIGKRWYSS